MRYLFLFLLFSLLPYSSHSFTFPKTELECIETYAADSESDIIAQYFVDACGFKFSNQTDLALKLIYENIGDCMIAKQSEIKNRIVAHAFERLCKEEAGLEKYLYNEQKALRLERSTSQTSSTNKVFNEEGLQSILEEVKVLKYKRCLKGFWLLEKPRFTGIVSGGAEDRVNTLMNKQTPASLQITSTGDVLINNFENCTIKKIKHEVWIDNFSFHGSSNGTFSDLGLIPKINQLTNEKEYPVEVLEMDCGKRLVLGNSRQILLLDSEGFYMPLVRASNTFGTIIKDLSAPVCDSRH